LVYVMAEQNSLGRNQRTSLLDCVQGMWPHQLCLLCALVAHANMDVLDTINNKQFEAENNNVPTCASHISVMGLKLSPPCASTALLLLHFTPLLLLLLATSVSADAADAALHMALACSAVSAGVYGMHWRSFSCCCLSTSVCRNGFALPPNPVLQVSCKPGLAGLAGEQ
jgi:hypothetical protein